MKMDSKGWLRCSPAFQDRWMFRSRKVFLFLWIVWAGWACRRNTAAEHHDHGHAHDEVGHGEADHSEADHDHDHGHAHGHADNGEAEAGHGHGHDHGHGGEALAITRFTDKLELFAEHPPVIADQEFDFLAHLTVLKDFKALESATLTLVLEGTNPPLEATVNKPLRPGIFRPRMRAPKQAGVYPAVLKVSGSQVEDRIEGFEIQVFANAHDAEHAAAGPVEEPKSKSEAISFLKEQQWQVPFATAFAKVDTIIPTIEVAGEIATPPSGQAQVGAAISGRVVAVKGGLPRPGEVVKKGQVLATLAPAPVAPEAEARADLAIVEATARQKVAKAALDRRQRLIADQAISQRELEEARVEFEASTQALATAHRAKKQFSGAAKGHGVGIYKVRAPIEGTVVDVSISEGQSLRSGDILFRLVNLTELWIVARVPEQDVTHLHANQNAAFQLAGLDHWFPLELGGEQPFASLINIGRVVDPRSRTVDVIYSVHPNDDRLRVGAFLRVAIPVGEAWKGVVVPRGALFEEQGRTLVYVQVEGESFEERVVRVGARSGALVAILSGIEAQERVVTQGANVIRLAARASHEAGGAGASHGHGHVH